MSGENNLPAGRLVLNHLNLDDRQYTLTLIREAARVNLIEPSELEQFQIKLMNALGQVIQDYTGGNSSSVRTDVAQRILGSILYGLDIHLLRLPSAEAAVEWLLHSDSASLVQSGRQAVSELTSQCRELLQAVRDSQIPVNLKAYEDLMINGFAGFLDGYNYQYDARNARLVIDYPLLADDMSRTGAIYARNYLEHLLLENRFCAGFDPAAIERLLANHGRKYGMPGSDLLVNLAELLLKQSLAAVLLGHAAADIDLDMQMGAWLEDSLQAATASDAELRIAAARLKVLDLCAPEEAAVAAYLQPHAELFSRQLLDAAHHHNLAAFLAINPDTVVPESSREQPGISLSDEDLRLLIGQITDLDDVEAKVDLILATVQHPDDLVEILGASCFWGSEYQVLFKRLGDYELAILSEPLIDRSPLSARRSEASGEWLISEDEADWQQKLLEYLASLDPERREKILEAVW